MNIKEFLSDDNHEDTNKSPSPIFYIKKYLRYWYFLLAGLVVSLSLALAYLYFTPKLYEVTSTIMINSNQKGAEFSQNMVLDDLNNNLASNVVENELEVLVSKKLISAVLEDLSLYTSFYIDKGFLRKREIYGENKVPITVDFLTPNPRPGTSGKMVKISIFDTESFQMEDEKGQISHYRFGETIINPFGEFTIQLHPTFSSNNDFPKTFYIVFNNMTELTFEYLENLNVEVINKLSTVISISLLDPVPEKGEDIINKLVELYNKEAFRNINSTAANTLDFIDEQMVQLTKDLAEIEMAVENYKNENSISDLSSESQLYIEDSRLVKDQLSDQLIKIQILESMETSIQKDENKYNTIQGSNILEDDNFNALVNKFNEVQRELQRMLKTTQPNNPLVIDFEEQINALKQDILENIKRNKRSLEISSSNLQANINRIEDRVGKVPLIERELLNLTRQQSIKQEHYLYLLKKREESELALTATSAVNARVIDPAASGIYPVSPLGKLIMIMAFLMGIGIPVGLIFLKEFVYGKITHLNEVEHATEVPVIGEIGHSKKKNLYLTNRSHISIIGEQISLIWSNLKFATMGNPNQVILTTSSISGEGKTFFSINLAMAIAVTGKKVVLMEYDLRKPTLLHNLNVSSNYGITDYIENTELNIGDLLKPHPSNPNLFFIGAGELPKNPLVVMNSGRLKVLLDELSKRFDHIIIDSAPIGLVADAYALAPYTDIAVFLMRYNYSEKSHIKLLNDTCKHKKFRNMVLVLNDAKMEHRYGYGYYESYKRKFNEPVF